MAVRVVAAAHRAAAPLAADRTVPHRLPVLDAPRRARLGVHVLAEVSEQTVLAEAPAALLVLARQHAARSHLDVLAEVAILVVICRRHRRWVVHLLDLWVRVLFDGSRSLASRATFGRGRRLRSAEQPGRHCRSRNTIMVR
eukprot:1496039-Rhodomonas_salina.5